MKASRSLCVLLSTTMLSTFSVHSFAQETKPSTPETEVVIVTAQKRSQKLQDVPISIQVLSTKKLDQLNVSNFNDYVSLIPSVSFQTSQPGSTNVYIRGVASGGDGNHSGSLPSVGIYLDEQPVTTIGGALDVHIYDIARIEALAGPQGTLYGASSEAGTIRIITNKPDHSSLYGRFDVEANSVKGGGNGGKLEGMINVPITDKIASRFVGWLQKDAGFIDNILGARSFLGGISVNNKAYVENNYNDVEISGGRAALKVDLDDNWTATASLFGQDQKNTGSFGYDPKVGDLKVQHFFPESAHDRFLQAALTVQGKIGQFDITYAGAYLDRKVDSESDYSDYAEAYDSLYSSVGGVAGYFYFSDLAGNTIDSRQRIIGKSKYTKESHELRLTSPATDRLRFVAGLFLQEQTHSILQDYKVAGLAPSLSVNGHPGTLWLTKQERIDKDLAAFGEISYDFTPEITLTVGGRAYEYDNSLIGFFGFGRDIANGPPWNAAGSSRTGVAGCYTKTGNVRDDHENGVTSVLLPAAVEGSPCTNLGVPSGGSVKPKSVKDNGFTPKINLSWKIDPELMVYGTWSKGFRPGGINRRSTVAPYDADFLTSLEFGVKSSFFDRELVLNAAIYRQDWEKFQFSYLGANSFTEVHNGPDATIDGLELDLTWRPSKALIITGSAAYLDPKTKKNLCTIDDPTFKCVDAGNFIAAPKGTSLPVTPKHKLASTVRYSFDAVGHKPYAQALITYQSESSSDLRTAILQSGTGDTINPALLMGTLPAFTNINVAFGTEWKSWTAEFYVNNLLNERGELSRFQQCGQCFQRPYVVTTTPMTSGIRLGSKF